MKCQRYFHHQQAIFSSLVQKNMEPQGPRDLQNTKTSYALVLSTNQSHGNSQKPQMNRRPPPMFEEDDEQIDTKPNQKRPADVPSSSLLAITIGSRGEKDALEDKFASRLETEMTKNDSHDHDSFLESSPPLPAFGRDKPVSRDSDILDDVTRSKHISRSQSRREARDHSSRDKRPSYTIAGTRSLIFNKDYSERMTAIDVRGGRHDGQIVSYFAIMGMEDSDIIHTVMAVKEMINAGYALNSEHQHDDLVSNAGILDGQMPYLRDSKKMLPKFRAPSFQPQVLSRVPNIERGKLLFPINLADFTYPDGVQVLSAQQVMHLRASHEEKRRISLPEGPDTAFFESLPVPVLSSKQRPNAFDDAVIYGAHSSGLQRHLTLTNQQGKVYHATCLDYFIDLKTLDDELVQVKRRPKNLADSDMIISSGSLRDKIEQIDIPVATYYLPFTMCIVSCENHYIQFSKILDRLYRLYTTGTLEKEGKSLEQAVNEIVFDLPAPPASFAHLKAEAEPKKPENHPPRAERQQQNLTKVQLSQNENDAVFFKAVSPFDYYGKHLTEISVLVQHFAPALILTLFKRQVFNTCSILTSPGVSQCIQGLMHLTFPLNCGILYYPKLSNQRLEYVSLCNHSLIGKAAAQYAPITQRNVAGEMVNLRAIDGQLEGVESRWIKLLTACTYRELVTIATEPNWLYKLHNFKVGTIVNEQEKPLWPHWEQIPGECKSRHREDEERMKEVRNSEQESDRNPLLLDEMQDNSAWLMTRMGEHPRQKPKQSYCFNMHGRLSYGQGAASRMQRKGTHRPAVDRFHDTLNDIGWPDTAQPIKQQHEEVNRLFKSIYAKSEVWALRQEIKALMLKEARTDAENQKITALRTKLYEVHLLPLMVKTADLQRSFFLMLKEILSTYVQQGRDTKQDDAVLRDWHGDKSQSGHMMRYVSWQKMLDVTELVRRDRLPGQSQKTRQDFQRFYRQLIYHPSLQNFLVEKFFPTSQEENFRQMHVLYQVKLQQRPPNSNMVKHFQMAYAHYRERNMHVTKRLFKEVARHSDVEVKFFPRRLRQSVISEDFLKNPLYKRENMQNDRDGSIKNSNGSDQQETETDRRFLQLFQALDVKKEIPKVLPLFVRIAASRYFVADKAKYDCIICWLFLFMSTLDYQLNPYLVAQLALPHSGINAADCHARPPAYFTCQAKMQQLLAQFLESALHMLIHRCPQEIYDLHQMTPLLQLLFQLTSKYHYLHLKLMEIINHDVDQRRAGGSATTVMTVASSFVVYQMHWDDKQVHIQGPADDESLNYNVIAEERKFRQLEAAKQAAIQLAKREFKKDPEQLARKIQNIESINFRSQGQQKVLNRHDYEPIEEINILLEKWHKSNKIHRLEVPLKWFDPYLLYHKNEVEWQPSKDRQDLLQYLKKEEEALTQKRLDERELIKERFKRLIDMDRLLPYKDDSQNQGGFSLKKVWKKITTSEQKKKEAADDKSAQQVALQRLNLLKKMREVMDELDRMKYARNLLKNQYVTNQQKRDIEKDMQLPSEHELFTNLLDRGRSFFSLAQLRQAMRNGKKAKGPLSDQDFITRQQLENFKLELKLTAKDIKCRQCKTTHEKESLQLGDNFRCTENADCKKNKSDYSLLVATLVVDLVTDLGTYELARHKLQHPKYLRQNVENIIDINREYNSLSQIDISAFSQMTSMSRQAEYWTAIYWFRSIGLPHMWLAPYACHIMDDNHPESRGKPVYNANVDMSEQTLHRIFVQEIIDHEKLKIVEESPLDANSVDNQNNKKEAETHQIKAVQEEHKQKQDKEAYLKCLHKKYKDMTPDLRMSKAQELRAARRDARKLKREQQKIDEALVPIEKQKATDLAVEIKKLD